MALWSFGSVIFCVVSTMKHQVLALNEPSKSLGWAEVSSRAELLEKHWMVEFYNFAKKSFKAAVENKQLVGKADFFYSAVDSLHCFAALEILSIVW